MIFIHRWYYLPMLYLIPKHLGLLVQIFWQRVMLYKYINDFPHANPTTTHTHTYLHFTKYVYILDLLL